MLPELLHGEETRAWGDGAYQGQTDAIHRAAPRGAGLDAAALPVQGLGGRSRAGAEPDQVADAQPGRACVRDAEVEVRVHQGALPRTEEERQPVVCHPGAGESVHGTQATATGGAGINSAELRNSAEVR